MRRILLVSVIALLILSGSYEAKAEGARFGIGVPFAKESLMEGGEFSYSLGGTAVTFPILFSTFKIEPELGIYRISGDGQSVTMLGYGASFAYVLPREDANIYLGIQFSMKTIKFSDDSDDESFNDIVFGPHVGGEYFFNDHVAIGAEARFDFVSLDSDWGDVESVFMNRTLTYLRIYF